MCAVNKFYYPMLIARSSSSERVARGQRGRDKVSRSGEPFCPLSEGKWRTLVAVQLTNSVRFDEIISFLNTPVAATELRVKQQPRSFDTFEEVTRKRHRRQTLEYLVRDFNRAVIFLWQTKAKINRSRKTLSEKESPARRRSRCRTLTILSLVE